MPCKTRDVMSRTRPMVTSERKGQKGNGLWVFLSTLQFLFLSTYGMWVTMGDTET